MSVIGHAVGRPAKGLLLLVDQIEAQLSEASTFSGKLTPTLLAFAFAGQLVRQVPADERAGELLAQLRGAEQMKRVDLARNGIHLGKDPAKVIQQLGRVPGDPDWNEEEAIDKMKLRSVPRRKRKKP
jgi:hypothetical protein